MKKTMLMTVGILTVSVMQARHPDLTRKATSGDRTFDLVISYWDDPDAGIKAKIEEVLGYFADGIFEATEGVHRLKKIHIYSSQGVGFCGKIKLNFKLGQVTDKGKRGLR